MDTDGIIDVWFHDYADAVYAYLRYFVDSNEVGDLVQETFMRALENHHMFREQSSPKTWLLKIARNMAIDAQRREKRRGWLPESLLYFVASKEKQPPEQAEINETLDDAILILRKMNASYKDVVLCRVIEGLSVAETAQVLGWTQSRVKTTTHRALKVLRRALDSQHTEVLPDGRIRSQR